MWFHTHSAVEVLSRPHWGSVRDSVVKPVAARPTSDPVRTALITGASSGIGRELAALLGEQRYNLVLIARDRDQLLALSAELESRHGITVTAIPKDLSIPAAAAEILTELRQRSIAVDVLVNNAGFAVSGEFASADVSQTIALLHVNIVALAHLTRLLLPSMLSRRWGRVLNIASIAGFYPGPLTACYNASKAFVISFSQALSNELADTGVSATCLCPGPTETRFAERAGLSESKAFSESVMDARSVAEAGYAAMMAGKSMAVCGMINKLRMLPIPLVPARILAHFSRKYHEVG